MGCNESHVISHQGQFTTQEYPKDVNQMKEFNLTYSNLVLQKHGEINKEYQLLNPVLGEGAFGSVRKAVHRRSGLIRAVKIIDKSRISFEELQQLHVEVEILKSLDHPNIIRIFESYDTDEFLYIVTELCTGGELFDKIVSEKSFNEQRAKETIRQILQALNYCHKNKIVHRDIKPENILYESTDPQALLKLVDFGTSSSFNPKVKMSQKLGTASYMAPEVLSSSYDEKCDIWGVGVILFIILSGQSPFAGEDDEEIMENVKKGKYSLEGEAWKQVSLPAKDFLQKLMEINPKKRLSAQQALTQQWMTLQTQDAKVDLPRLTFAFNNLQQFRTGKKLQEATWVFLVSYLSSKEEQHELLQVFQQLDLDQDGKLQRNELIIGYKNLLKHPNPEEEVDRILAQVDKNNSGEIDFSEWMVATVNREQMLSKNRLETAFKMFDADGSGTVSKNEIKQMFNGIGNVDDKVWNQLISEVDPNGDGELTYNEFKDMMLAIVK